MAVIWAVGNAPKDDAILGCERAPRVIERAKLTFYEPEHRMRLELPVLCEASFKLDEDGGGIAVVVSWTEHDPLEVEAVGATLSTVSN